MPTRMRILLACAIVIPFVGSSNAADKPHPQRFLLIGQKPDGHPFSTHEYMPGVRLLARLLADVPDTQVVVEQADGNWPRGPELIDRTDSVVLFVSEGAKWIHQDPRRLASFRALAERGGGFACLHWGMGCRDAEYIAGYLDLFGGCHGGPDRRYKVVDVASTITTADHPVVRGIDSFDVKDEFYYTLKFPKSGRLTPLVNVPVEGKSHTVAWAWERPNRGRSFGFSGLHFHHNWSLPEYRRLVLQGVLWTAKIEIPSDGLDVAIDEEAIKLKPREPKPSKQ